MTDRTELRRWLGGMQSLAECEGIYDGNASVCSIVVRVLPMLDQLDAAEAALNDAILYEKEGRDALARQTPLYLAAEAALARVRELHYPADNDPARTPRCEGCHGKAGTHPCGCWADMDREPVCGHCNQGHKGLSVAWPCPTIAAMGGGES